MSASRLLHFPFSVSVTRGQSRSVTKSVTRAVVSELLHLLHSKSVTRGQSRSVTIGAVGVHGTRRLATVAGGLSGSCDGQCVHPSRASLHIESVTRGQSESVTSLVRGVAMLRGACPHHFSPSESLGKVFGDWARQLGRCVSVLTFPRKDLARKFRVLYVSTCAFLFLQYFLDVFLENFYRQTHILDVHG